LYVLQDPARRRAARAEMRRRAGGKASALLRRLHREQVNLAMVRSRAETGDDPEVVRQRGYCKSLRDALLAIPGAAAAGDQGVALAPDIGVKHGAENGSPHGP